MIGRDPVKLLEYEAKRRPLVKEMWERRWLLTDEEIDTAKLPLPWFRKAFKQARNQAVREQREKAIREAALSNPVGDDYEEGANSVMGTTVEYLGDPGWFETGGPCKFTVEVKARAWLFFPETGGCWDYQTFFEIIPEAFLQNRKIANQSRADYVEAWAKELCRRF